jgi:hypothetical protein
MDFTSNNEVNLKAQQFDAFVEKLTAVGVDVTVV